MAGPWEKYHQPQQPQTFGAADPSRRLEDEKTRAEIARLNADLLRTRGEMSESQARTAKLMQDIQMGNPQGQNQTDEFKQRRANVEAATNQLQTVDALFRNNFQGGGVAQSIREYAPDFLSGTNSQFNSAAAGLAGAMTPIIKVAGSGTVSDYDAMQLAKAGQPSSWDRDTAAQQKLDNMRVRIDAQREALGLPPAKWGDEGQALDLTRQTVSDVGAETPTKQIARGKTKTVENKMLKAVAGQLGKMVASGQPDEKIVEFLTKSGVDPAATNIQPILEYRRTNPEYKEWKRLNPTKPYPIGPNFWREEVELPPPSGLFEKAAATGPGAALGTYATQATQAFTGNRLDDIAGALGGNAEDVRTGTDLLRQEHPIASLAGDVTGQAALEALMSRVPGGRALMASKAGRRGVDAAYGGYAGSGAADDDPLGGAIAGAGLGVAGGMTGRGAQRGIGAAATGVTDETLKYLHQRNIPLTIGAMARRSEGPLANFIANTEERIAGIPGAGDIVQVGQDRGMVGFNRALTEDAVAPVGAPGIDATGEAAIEYIRGIKKSAYKKALDGITLAQDGQYATDMAVAIQKGNAIPEAGAKFDFVVKKIPNLFDVNGTISGERVQQAIKLIRKSRSSLSKGELGHEVAEALTDVENAIVGMIQRQAPEVMPKLQAANKIHGNQKILERAMGKQAAQRANMMTPEQVNQASILNTRRFGGEDLAMSKDRPFYDLSKAGMDVLGDTIGDSGTAGRAMIIPLLAALGSGAAGAGGGAVLGGQEGAQEGGAYGGTLGLLALAAAAPYSKVGQKGIQAAMLGERPVIINQIGEYLKKHPLAGGLLGQAGVREYLRQQLSE